jgi:hypothetical protein
VAVHAPQTPTLGAPTRSVRELLVSLSLIRASLLRFSIGCTLPQRSKLEGRGAASGRESTLTPRASNAPRRGYESRLPLLLYDRNRNEALRFGRQRAASWWKAVERVNRLILELSAGPFGDGRMPVSPLADAPRDSRATHCAWIGHAQACRSVSAETCLSCSGPCRTLADFGSNDVSMYTIDATTGDLTPIGRVDAVA